MFVQQFYVESLGHYSYLIGSTDAGVAFVVDPKRDVEDYTETARAQDLRITHILETHLHNDYVSGNRALAEATGARICHSAEAALTYDHQPLHDGDKLTFGELTVHVLRTPGHTPEHLAYTVYDTDRSRDLPALILTGGDLLVGSVGRPDLLGAELGRKLAPQLYDSLHEKILPVGDHVVVLPTHGAGSSCGASISTTRTSTIGYEKAANPYLQQPDREAFVRYLLQAQPTIPAYYRRMRPINQGADPLPPAPTPPLPLRPGEFAGRAADGESVVLDTRMPMAFGGAHIAGAINIGLDSNFTTWAGSILPPDRPLLLVVHSPADLDEVAQELLRIGYSRLAAYLQGGMMAWVEAGRPVETLAQIEVRELQARLKAPGTLQVIDVRAGSEWQEGHIAGAIHIVGNDVPERLSSMDREREFALICGGGYRSSIAASLLRRAGFPHVVNVIGGMSAWNRLHLPTVQDNVPSGQ